VTIPRPTPITRPDDEQRDVDRQSFADHRGELLVVLVRVAEAQVQEGVREVLRDRRDLAPQRDAVAQTPEDDEGQRRHDDDYDATASSRRATYVTNDVAAPLRSATRDPPS
jgi:hypothetical protein